MNPDLGDIVSELFYDGRLISYKDNSKRKILLIKKKDGIQFFPIKHEGNIQYSSEEVDFIVKLTEIC